MTNIKLIKIIGAMLLLLSQAAFADAGVRDQSLKTEMTQFLQQQKIPGAAVLIYRQGRIDAYYFGVSSLQTQKPVTGETVFELGSMTKTFTGLLLAEEVNVGMLALNDKVSGLLKNGDQDSRSIQKITLLQLATHSSALPFNAPNIDYNARDTLKVQAALQTFLKTWQAPYSPGAQSLYSNLGFGLLGLALSEKEDKPLSQLMQEKILVPLHMQHSGLHVSNKNYAQGYTAIGNPVTSPQAGLLGGAWAMKSSANDMQYYLKAALQLKGTPTEIQEAFQLAETPFVIPNTWNSELGLGWIITPLDHIAIDSLLHAPAHHNMAPKPIQKIQNPTFIADSLIDKTGATDGFRSYIGIVPSKKIGIVIMINRYIADSGALQNEGRKILLLNLN